MRETRSSGSVEGVMSNRDPYSDFIQTKPKVFDLRLRFRTSAETIGAQRDLFNTTPVDENSKESQSLTALSCVAWRPFRQPG
jgi:hypothetical protein